MKYHNFCFLRLHKYLVFKKSRSLIGNITKYDRKVRKLSSKDEDNSSNPSKTAFAQVQSCQSSVECTNKKKIDSPHARMSTSRLSGAVSVVYPYYGEQGQRDRKSRMHSSNTFLLPTIRIIAFPSRHKLRRRRERGFGVCCIKWGCLMTFCGLRM